MKAGWITKRTVAIAVAAMAVGAALGASPAGAQTVVNGSLSFSGDPGEPITGGQSYRRPQRLPLGDPDQHRDSGRQYERRKH